MQYNKNIFKYLFSFVLVLMSMGFAFGHNPSNSTTLLIEGKKEGTWMLQIRASLTAFEQEVHTRYTKDSYKTPEEFKELVSKMLENTVVLKFNNTPVELNKAQIKLGHETVVVFQFANTNILKEITYQNKAFTNIFNSKNTFFVVKNGVGKNKFTLNKNNNFLTKITVKENELVTTKQLQKASFNIVWLLPLVLLSILGFGYFYKRKELNPYN